MPSGFLGQEGPTRAVVLELEHAVNRFAGGRPATVRGNEGVEIGMGDGDRGSELAEVRAVALDGDEHPFGVVFVFGVEGRIGPVARVIEHVHDEPVTLGFDD